MGEGEQRSGANGAGKLKVFISYSRTDESFADELRLGLEDKGYTVTIDKYSIRKGEDWKNRLRKLIAACDTVVFVLSPDSARSPICTWEVDEAFKEGKRIVPVLCRGLNELPRSKQEDGTPWPPGPAKAPERLTAPNFPRFDEGRSFMAGLFGLVEALEADHEWIEKHSRLATRARDWDEGARPTNRLMSGPDIQTAKVLLETRKSSSPLMLPVQLDFIQASEAHEAAQTSARERELDARNQLTLEALKQSRRVVQRTRQLLAVAVVLATAASGGGWMAWTKQREAEAQRQRVEVAIGNLARATRFMAFYIATEYRTTKGIPRKFTIDVLNSAQDLVEATSRAAEGNLEIRYQSVAVLGSLTDSYLEIDEPSLARQTAEAAVAILRELTQSAPRQSTWQRDLSVSYSKLGDALLAQDNRQSTRSTLQKVRTAPEYFEVSSPDLSGWLRDLGRLDRQGFQLVGEDLRELAISEYSKAAATREKLSAENPANAAWQRDLAVAYFKLACAGSEPVHNLTRSLKIFEILKTLGGLSEFDKRLIHIIEQDLREVSGNTAK